jgi:hypothetical protein
MISIQLSGRLGNQMFQYAVCRTVAEKKGYDFHISKDLNNHGQNISNYFDLNMGVDSNITNYTYSEDHTRQTYNPEIFNIPDNTLIWGYYQTDKYISDNNEMVKKWFSIGMDDTTNDIIKNYPVDEFCYIHFRGTDYKDWDSGNMFLPFKYFTDAMNKIRSIKSDIKFIVVTDDIEMAKVYFTYCVIISNDMMVDFKLLYFSKYTIITNSSFSWWAAWLSDDKKLVIAPNNWFNYNRPQLGFNPVDIKTNKFEYV